MLYNSDSKGDELMAQRDSLLLLKAVMLCFIPPRGTPVIQEEYRQTEFKTLSFCGWSFFRKLD